MGEMADFTNETGEEEEDLRLQWRLGHLSEAEAYDAGIIDEEGYEIEAKEMIQWLLNNRNHVEQLYKEVK